MSTIEFSEQDFAAIERAAAAEGIPVDEWVVANLPLNGSRAESHASPSSPEAKPAKTMADLFAGRLGGFNSGTGQPSSNNIGESFAEYLEQKHRAGRL
jgi:hypothetical protein